MTHVFYVIIGVVVRGSTNLTIQTPSNSTSSTLGTLLLLERRHDGGESSNGFNKVAKATRTATLERTANTQQRSVPAQIVPSLGQSK
jgi:hypothetical protein